jgi:hypothetical protein
MFKLDYFAKKVITSLTYFNYETTDWVPLCIPSLGIRYSPSSNELPGTDASTFSMGHPGLLELLYVLDTPIRYIPDTHILIFPSQRKLKLTCIRSILFLVWSAGACDKSVQKWICIQIIIHGTDVKIEFLFVELSLSYKMIDQLSLLLRKGIVK